MAKRTHVHNNICDDCIHKKWVTDKERNYSMTDHKPITLVCLKSGVHNVRGTQACKLFEPYA